ncbi:MAG: serine/threonine-protein kinase [Nitrospira sp.]
MAPQVLAGKYELREEIARGGMGIIYKAFDHKLHDTVVIKVVHAHLSSDSSFAERFLREARAMAKLRQHENIVKIYAVEEEGETQFLVMEYCPGDNLRSLIRKTAPLPVHRVVQIAQQLASALAYAHSEGVIHRDIKPANVLFDKRGKVKLTDFGIAAALDEASITKAQDIIGTPEYMSPEQARGVKLDQLTGRSDLYSLGIVMYEMLTGRTPYAESSGTSILGKLAYDRKELTLQFPNHVSAMVRDVVRSLVRRNPDERMPDAETLAGRLREILNKLTQAPPAKAPDDSDSTMVLAPLTAKLGKDTLAFPPDEETIVVPFRRTDGQELSLAAREPSRPGYAVGLQESKEATEKSPLQVPTKDTNQDQGFPPRRVFLIKRLIVWAILLVTAVGLVLYYLVPPEIRPADHKAPVPEAEKPVSLSDDPQLRMLLDNFEQAYERRDVETLRSISRMDDARLRNIEMMFGYYKTLKLSRANITPQDHGVAALLVIDTAITTDGKLVDLSPIAKEIRLHIPRQGKGWDKIEW